MRKFDFVLILDHISFIDDLKLNKDFLENIFQAFLDGFKNDKNPSFKVQIKDENLVKGGNEFVAFNLILICIASNLSKVKKNHFRKYVVGESGVRLLFKVKKYQRAYNCLASTFLPNKDELFLSYFNKINDFLKKSFNQNELDDFFDYLLNTPFWNVVRTHGSLLDDTIDESECENAKTFNTTQAQDEILQNTNNEKNDTPDLDSVIDAKAPENPPIKIKDKKIQKSIQKTYHNELFKILNNMFNKIKKLDQKAFNKKFKILYKNIFKKNMDFWTKLMFNTSRLEIFVCAFLMLDFKFDYRLNNYSDIVNIFRNQVSILGKKGIKIFTFRFCQIAKKYISMADTDLNKKHYFNEPDFRLFNLLYRSDQRYILPLVLLLRVKCGNNKFIKCIKLLERFFLFRLVCQKNDDLSLFFWHIFEYLRENECKGAKKYLKNRLFYDKFIIVPEYIEVINTLENIKDNFYARHILFWIELYLRKKSSKWHKNGLRMKYTLEHILPQSYKKHWNIKEDDSSMQTLIYQIGNMTLLEDELNVAISNLAWLQKRTIMRLDKEPMLLNKNILDLSRWSIGHIHDRTKWIKEIFMKIWKPIKGQP